MFETQKLKFVPYFPKAEAVFLTSRKYSMKAIGQLMDELNVRIINRKVATGIGAIASKTPDPTVQTVSWISAKVVAYLQDTQALKEALILEQVDGIIIDMQMHNLKAKIDTIVNNMNLIEQRSKYQVGLAVSASTVAGEVVSLLTNPEHIYMQHPMASTPYFGIFCRVHRNLSEYIFANMPDKPLHDNCKNQENTLRQALANYERKCIDKRLEGICMVKTPFLLCLDFVTYYNKDSYAGLRTYDHDFWELDDIDRYRSNVRTAYEKYFKKLRKNIYG